VIPLKRRHPMPCDGFLKRRSLVRQASWILSVVVCAGCTAYTPAALTTQHPAHPDAVAGPELPASTTLAYQPADIPSLQPAAAHGRPDAASSGAKGGPTVVGEGKVIAVVPASREIVLTHGVIPGFMDPMTMGYPIEPLSLLQGVKAGDTVRFTIDTEAKAIVALEQVRP
jgi:Cu(I)/Ag(I) efflux system protein CusF